MIAARPWLRLFLGDGTWFGAAALVALAAGVIGDQLFRHPPLGWRYTTAAQRALQSTMPSAAALAPINIVALEEVEALLARGDVITLDARPRVFYELGHLPGARSLSREDFSTDFPALEPVLRVPGRTLLIYCSDVSCEDGARVARALQERGVGPLLLFAGGVAEWETAGKPLEVTR